MIKEIKYFMKSIKYWKPVAQNLSLSEAYMVLNRRCYNATKYERIGIRLGNKVIDQYDKYDEMTFNLAEATSKCWEVVIPDDNKEDLLYKCREMVKNEHFTGLTNEKIDKMNISDLFNVIMEYCVVCDENVKYRVIKNIIELKLYKKN